jgi:hypothetical protein
MAAKIKLLRSTVAGRVPATLESGQIAINEADGILFFRDGSGTVRSFNFINPTGPTVAAADNSTRLATTAFVKAAITAVINGAPGALDTLQELAAALGNDATFATSVTNQLASKVATTRTIATSGLASGGGNLSADRTITVPVATTAQAQSGGDDTTAMTPLKVAQAVASKVASGTTTFRSSATGDNARTTGYQIADGSDIGELNRNNQYYDDRTNNCSGYLPGGNCLGNPQWTPPNGNWWTWGLGFQPGNPSGFDFVGGQTVGYAAVSVGFVFGAYGLTADEIGGGEYHRVYNNCNCGAFNCYTNCNCNCDCNCNCGDG